jgi:hypothetical protein
MQFVFIRDESLVDCRDVRQRVARAVAWCLSVATKARVLNQEFIAEIAALFE